MNPNLLLIKNMTAQFCGLTATEIDKVCRKPEIVIPRQMAMSIAVKLTKSSQEEIGVVMGGKNHSTVSNAVKAINNACDTDKLFKSEYTELYNRIKAVMSSGQKIQVHTTITLKESQYRSNLWSYYYELRGKCLYSTERVIKVSFNSVNEISESLNMSEIERIDVSIINTTPDVNILQPTNEMSEASL